MDVAKGVGRSDIARPMREKQPAVFLTTGPSHVMSSAIDPKSGQGALAASRAGAFCSISYHCPVGQKC